LTVDASIAVKWVVDEPGHEAARAVLDPAVILNAPALLLAEVGNVLWKKLRQNRIDRRMADEAAVQVGDLVHFLHDVAVLYPRAVRLSLDLDHPIYDCFYLACAERAQTPLLTADRRLVNRLAGTEFEGLVRTLG
jgi:predicted nucleic acid-binding protein